MVINVNRLPDYCDIDLDFTSHPATKDVARLTGEAAIKRAVRNLVQTNFYERPFRSHIGSNALKLLFENATPMTATFLENAIKEVIINFEPRVLLQAVSVSFGPDDNQYTATIQYTIRNRLEPTIQSFILERIR